MARPELDPAALRRAFGAFPTGVVAVAGRVQGRVVGMAASSFTSVSLDPPLVSVSVSRGSRTWGDLRRAGRIGLSVLADHHDRCCLQLAGPPQGRFSGLSVTVTPDGAVMLDEAVSTFECSLYAEVEAGDHVVVLLRLHAVADSGGASPLVFHRSGFAHLAATDPEPSGQKC